MKAWTLTLVPALALALLLAPPAAMAAKGVDVEIDGLNDPLTKNVRAILGLVNESPDKRPPNAVVRDLYAGAPDEIKAALQPFGYYRPDIQSSLNKTGDHWQATFHIDPGPPTQLKTLELRVTGPGRENDKIQRALAATQLATGHRLIQSDYKSTKQSLLDASRDTGYLDAHYVKHQIAVHPRDNAAAIHLVLDTGPRYYFGPITIKQDILAPDFVRRFNPIEPGDVFSTNRLLELELALRDSKYFSLVSPSVHKDQARQHRIPVDLKAKPSPSARYKASAGYGTDTGPRIGIGVLFRHINRHGHQFSTNMRISAVKSTLNAQYKIPVNNVRTDFFAVNGTVEQIHINDTHSKRQDLGIELNERWLGGKRRLYLDYDHAHFWFGEDGRPRTTSLLIPGITYTRKLTDDPMFPRRGYRLILDAHGAAEPAFSDTSYVSVDANLRAARPLGDKTRLLMYAELGAIHAADFNTLPPMQRFFTGGSRTVRGYGYKELAPRNAADKIIGGRYLAVGSLEIDHLFIGNFGAALFADAGNVSDDWFPTLRTDAGIGLRYRTPIGMVRLDIARTLNDPVSDHWHLQVSIGPYF